MATGPGKMRKFACIKSGIMRVTCVGAMTSRSDWVGCVVGCVCARNGVCTLSSETRLVLDKLRMKRVCSTISSHIKLIKIDDVNTCVRVFVLLQHRVQSLD